MPSEAESPRLTLQFSTNPHLELRATEFHLPKTPDGPMTLKCSEGKAGDGFFEWRAGTQALSLCLIRFLCFPKVKLSKGIKFVFEGNDEHPAKTVDYVVAKANKSYCWQLNMFGNFSDGNCRLKRFIKRRNPDRSDKNRNYELEIQHEELPQRSITVEVDGRDIKGLAALKRLADNIEAQWHATSTSRVPDGVQVVEACELGDETADLPEASKTNKPLSELFRSLPVASIISHITAALLPARGQEAIEESLAEILSPDCLNVVAERIVGDSIDHFCDFFYAEYDTPPNIKRSIAAVIASNKELRAALAVKVANCDYQDMSSWFQAFSFFCARDIVVEVEHALNAAAEEPGFKEKFEIYAPNRLPSLVAHFSRYGCVSAVRFFEKLILEGREREENLKNLLG